MIVNYLALIVALLLSFVAAYYSIVGLAVIFASALIPVIIMASVLEAGKVVAASWLYRNWNTAPRLIKYYLVTAVAILMFITSMGIFGFLSKAHLDQTILAGDTGIELKVLDDQIKSEQRTIENAQRSLSALDRLVDQSDTETSIKLRNQQARERKLLTDSISTASNKIKDLSVKAAPLRKESLKIQAEVGPIKYIADLIYGESSEQLLEKTVRTVIIIIVLVFDPLAIALLLAANHSLTRKEAPTPEPPKQQSTTDEAYNEKWMKFFGKKTDQDHGNCYKCNTKLQHATGIGIFCPNPKCDVIDDTKEPKVKKGRRKEKEVVQEPVVEKKEGWSPRWYQRTKQLIERKKTGIIEVDKKSIVKMK